MSEQYIHINEYGIINKVAVKNFFNDLLPGSYLLKADAARKRTLPQNAYYHGVVVPMVYDGLKAAGFDTVRTKEDAHEIMKALFLKNHFFNPNTGEAVEWVGSTTKLQTDEFNMYLESIWQWASDYLNINIPSPGQQASIW